MFHEVDAALVRLITEEALGEAAVAVSLEAPNRPWFAAVQTPTVNVFLYDVRENLARRDVMHEPVLDDAGRVVGRRPPALRYDLHYLLSVWGAPDPVLEHQVLAALLVGIGRFEVLPEALVPEEHRELGVWHLSVASGGKRMMPGMFGGEMKLQAEVSITVPLPPRVPLPVGPPVDRPMDLRVSGAGGQQDQVRGRPPAPGDPRAAGRPPVAPGAPPGAPGAAPEDPARQRQQLARAVAAGGQGPPGAPGAPGAQRPQGPPRPQGAPGGGARPAGRQDPMAVLRSALAQAAQAQAALAQAQSLVARAMAGPAGRPGTAAAQAVTTRAAPPADGPAPPGDSPAPAGDSPAPAG